ncbi:hypothetical protein [Insolitispirillum peregrinum]|uniref:hypothetical protein n=1 Tax=Insolitispirillum peregrinum TaxID=80876 RepID=UPI0036210F82
MSRRLFRPVVWSLSVRALVVLLAISLLAAALIVLPCSPGIGHGGVPGKDAEQLESLKALFSNYDAEESSCLRPDPGWYGFAGGYVPDGHCLHRADRHDTRNW